MQNFPGLSIVNQENVSVDSFSWAKGGYLIYNCLLLPTLHIVDNPKYNSISALSQ